MTQKELEARRRWAATPAGREVLRSSRRRYVERNKDKVLEAERGRYYRLKATNPEFMELKRVASRKYRENNPDKVAEQRRIYCENNPEKHKEARRRHRARKRRPKMLKLLLVANASGEDAAS